MAGRTRRALIEHRVLTAGRIEFQALAAEFGVSEMTIRRDVDALEDRGVLRKVIGGAIAVEPGTAPLIDTPPEDVALADRFALATEAGQRMILLAGTLSVAAASALVRNGVTVAVTTDSFAAAAILAEQPETEITVLGGLLDRATMSTHGAAAVSLLETVNTDLTVLADVRIDLDRGVTVDSAARAAVLRAAINAGRRLLVIAGTPSLGTVAAYRVCPIGAVDTLLVAADAARHPVPVTLATRGAQILVSDDVNTVQA